MNEDGNNIAPQGPIFSSSSDNPPSTPAPQSDAFASQPSVAAPQDTSVFQSAATETPEPSTTMPFFSSDKPSISQQNPFAQAAHMQTPTPAATPETPAAPAVPAQPATPATPAAPEAPAAPITSAPSDQPNRAHGMLHSRRYKEQAAPKPNPSFAGAPDFFREAANQNYANPNDTVMTIGGDGAAAKQSSSKGKFAIIGILAVLLIVGGVVGVMALSGGKNSNGNSGNPAVVKDESDSGIAEGIKKYNEAYNMILTSYRAIDFSDSDTVKSALKDKFYVASTDVLEATKSTVDEQKKLIEENDARTSVDVISKKYPEYSEIRQSTDAIVSTIVSNVDMLKKFNEAFSTPLEKEDGYSADCSLSSTAEELLADSDETIKAAAEKYKVAFCEIYKKRYDKTFAYSDLSSETVTNAKKALIGSLQKVDSSANKIQELSNLVSKVKNENK